MAMKLPPRYPSPYGKTSIQDYHSLFTYYSCSFVPVKYSRERRKTQIFLITTVGITNLCKCTNLTISQEVFMGLIMQRLGEPVKRTVTIII